MGGGEGAQRFARPIAEIIGLAAEDGVVRYGVMSLTFLFLAVAAYLFGPEAPLEALGALGVAYALIFFPSIGGSWKRRASVASCWAMSRHERTTHRTPICATKSFSLARCSS